MSTGFARVSLCVLFLSEVFCVLLEPSPTARLRKYTSNEFICDATKNWGSVILSIQLKGELPGTVAFFTVVSNDCHQNIVPTPLYQSSCDFRNGKFNLVINNVTDTYDECLVICTANYGSRSETANTTVDVQYSPIASPSITQTPGTPVTEGDKVVLSCEIAGGNPLASITWRCNGFSTVTTTTAPTTDKVVSSVEHIVTREDNNKECTCIGNHKFWTEERVVKHILTVYYRPIVTISLPYNNYNVVENTTNFKLICEVTYAYPAVTSYEWYRDNTKISENGTYIISPVHRSNTGSYTCRALNSVGTSDPSSAVELNVIYGIEINSISTNKVSEGTKLNITCSGQSNPAMTDTDVTWTKQNNEWFYQKGRHLVLTNVNRTDSGTYICSVVLTLSPTLEPPINVTGKTHAEVDVLYLPTVTIFPARRRYNLVENTTHFNLTCEVIDTNPNVTSYKWYKDGVNISTASSYIISSVQRSHKGTYTCVGTNVVGDSSPSTSVQIIILYGVKVDPISISQPTEGTNLHIICSGDSFPEITDDDVTWTNQNNVVFHQEGRHLNISNVNRTDSGTYICSVVLTLSPTLGEPITISGTTHAVVDVLYKPSVRVSADFDPNYVKENRTMLRMNCEVNYANPNVTIYGWYKDGIYVNSAPTYTILTVSRSHSGSYKCNATNSVGSSDPSEVFQLNVLYGVSLQLSKTDVSINESESLDLTCTGDGNPRPTLKYVYKYNNSEVGEHHNNVTSISVEHANCRDTGVYTCSGNNSIGEPVVKSTNIRVACKPRSYNNLEKQDIFINGTDEILNISATFTSFPLSNISWMRELPNGNSTELESEFITTVIPSQLPYEQTSLLQKNQLKPSDFGIYFVTASNIHGSFLLTINVISKRKPDPPTNITADCDVNSVRLTWISRFNGGENQTFRIIFVNNNSNQKTYKDDISDEGEDTTINDSYESLSPNTLYLIFLEAYNIYGIATSTEITNCTTKENQIESQPVTSALVGGIVGSISALLVVVIVFGGLYFWRRRQLNGRDKKLLKRYSKEKTEEEDGLKENPLYVTSGEASNAATGPVYGVVNKKRQTMANMTLDEKNDQGPVYSQVQKPYSKEKNNRKEKKAKKTPRNDNYKDIELGTVYENSDKLSKQYSSDELYANAEEQDKQCVNLAKGYIPKKNKDGLIYADLDLVPGPNGRKFVIRGIENKTNYAMIDLSIKVDPLPSDEEEEDKDSEKNKLAANECNE